MGMGFILGRMAGCTKAITLMTRKVGLVSIHGPTVVNTMACGRMESSMAKANIFCPQACKDEDTGEMGCVKNGLTPQIK